MGPMSLAFILCKPAEVGGPRTRSQATRSPATKKRKKEREQQQSKTTSIDRLLHVRQLQNLRQRRYRERKKSSVSALQAAADQLLQENATLEATILHSLALQ